MCKTSMYIAYMYNDSQLQRYKRQPGNDFCTMHTKIVIIIICILNENFKRTTPFGLLQLQNTARIWIMDISGIWMTCPIAVWSTIQIGIWITDKKSVI